MSSLNDEGFMPEIERAARDQIYNGAQKVPANLQEFRDAIGRLPAGIVLQEQHGIRQYFTLITTRTAFLLGGAVKGGRVITDWPGLKAPSSIKHAIWPHHRSACGPKGALRDHLGLSERVLATTVFPIASP
jgi:hypothetical protein